MAAPRQGTSKKASARKTARKKRASRKTANAPPEPAAEQAADENEPSSDSAQSGDLFAQRERSFRETRFTPTTKDVPAEVLPNLDWVTILTQGNDGASVGFALAAMINYLRAQQGDPIHVAPFMLYENAKHYDEWQGEDYQGSSLRGGMKGWWIHGVLPAEERPSKLDLSDADVERALSLRPLETIRLGLSVDELRLAVAEFGAIVASANMHDGWREARARIPFGPNSKTDAGGHAFAIVGYTSDGFIVQNSWGKTWGGVAIDGTTQGGLSVWTWEDAASNLMDAWTAKVSAQPLGLEDPETYESPATEAAPRFATANELAGYLADVATSTDSLGVSRDVQNLSQVIMAEDWKPPLSIGLFGDWGTGKSSFIAMMKKQVREIARIAEVAERNGEETAYVSDVIQIEFNAWHYLDANLWASLVTHLFDEVQRTIFGATPDEEDEAHRQQLAELMREFETTQMRVAEAKVREGEATRRVDEINRQDGIERSRIGRLREQYAQLLAAGAETMQEMIESDPELERRIAEVEALHGRGKLSYEALVDLEKRLRTTGGKALRIVEDARSDGLKLSIVAVLAIVFGLSIFPAAAPWLNETLRSALGWASAAAGALLTAFGVVLPHLDQVNAFLDKTRKALDRVDSAREKQLVERQVQIEQAQRELDRIAQEREAAERRSSELAARISKLEAGGGLQAFLLDRVAHGDYKEQLGIVAMVRRDLEKLQRKLQRGVVVEEGGEFRTRKFDRIVLYIDDLDRCPPDRVMEVLQAVHLLMAIPLFVVVVAVDPRWLLQCLELYFSELLRSSDDGIQDEWAASPQNYLEKIIQIPFSLRRMTDDGYKNFVASLFPDSREEVLEVVKLQSESTALEVEIERQQRQLRRNAAADASEASGMTGEATEADRKVEDSEQTRALRAQIEENERRRAELEEKTREAQLAQSRSWSPDLSANPKNLQVSDAEHAFVARLRPLLLTPRITKRLVNMFRLIRVSLDPHELAAFERSDHEAVLVLLAVLYGAPDVAPEFFAQLERTSEPDLASFLDALESAAGSRAAPWEASEYGSRGWRRVQKGIEAIDPAVDDTDVYKRWVRGVGRYSFQVGHYLRHG